MAVAAQALAVAKNAVAHQRQQAVSAAIGRIRELERTLGVTRVMLAEVRKVMLDLARHQELFPREDFPLTDGQNQVYRLAEDADHRFALYMSCGMPGKKVPPHNHTTWAVIAGVDGEEENFFYERSDDGQTEWKGTLKQIDHEVVRLGTGVCLMPEDIHHIQTPPDRPNMHLHMYGLSLEHLPNRVSYDVAAGTYKLSLTIPNIVYMQ
jgi:predicted metal-dependent enzyme (double-stranded beta helix superfamily)